MKIEPKATPTVIQPSTGQADVTLSARERAIARLVNAPQAQEHPVQNPNQVSPEEMSAIKAPSQPAEKTAQNTNNDGESSSTKDSNASAETKPEPQRDEQLSNQYANLAKKERALRAKVQTEQASIKAKEDALTAREEAIKAKEAEYLTNYVSKSKLKLDPLAVLTEEGVTYDDITRAILNPQAQQDPRVMRQIEELKAKVEAQEKTQVEARKAYETQQKQAYNQAVAEIKSETTRLVANDPSFEMIKTTGSVDDVVDLIEKTYHKDKILLTVEEAAQAVEDYLVDQAVKLAQNKKIIERLQKTSSQPASTDNKQPTQAPQMKTLTNAVNASKKLSARDRAIAAFKGELK